MSIELAGLALAILPFLIRVLRHYRRTLADYALGLETQRVIFLNNIEQVLDGVVDDDKEVRELVNDPAGQSYGSFLENMTSLYSALMHLARKLDVDVVTGPRTAHCSRKEIVLFVTVLSKAVYDDLLHKIRDTNDILRTLIEQSTKLDSTRDRRSPWRQLLLQLREARNNAEGLFRAIIRGPYWSCACRDLHRALLRIQSNPWGIRVKGEKESKFHITFTNIVEHHNKVTWARSEVEFEPCQVAPVLPLCTLTLGHQLRSPTLPRARVRFDIPTPKGPISTRKTTDGPQIRDICSILSPRAHHVPLGFVAMDSHPTVRYVLTSVECFSQSASLKTLQQALPDRSRRDRLYIATELACAVIQYHGTWLRDRWDSSDISLLSDYEEDHDVPPGNLYLSWPLDPQPYVQADEPPSPLIRNHILFPLGIALIELSLGLSIVSLRLPQDMVGNQDSVKLHTASRLLKKVYQESGANYYDAVQSCLSWSGVDPPCFEDQKFEEKVFNTVVAPLLKDLAHFEDLG
ncbi:hypothetical protein BDV12DRAFT_209267 [Aspergillus spectabilis]